MLPRARTRGLLAQCARERPGACQHATNRAQRIPVLHTLKFEGDLSSCPAMTRVVLFKDAGDGIRLRLNAGDKGRHYNKGDYSKKRAHCASVAAAIVELSIRFLPVRGF